MRGPALVQMPRKAAPAQLAVEGRSLLFLTLDPFELIEREIANLYSSAAQQFQAIR